MGWNIEALLYPLTSIASIHVLRPQYHPGGALKVTSSFTMITGVQASLLVSCQCLVVSIMTVCFTYNGFTHAKVLLTIIVDYAELVTWAADQPWSTGKVGLTGFSYLGLNQVTIPLQRKFQPYIKNLADMARVVVRGRASAARTGLHCALGGNGRFIS